MLTLPTGCWMLGAGLCGKEGGLTGRDRLDRSGGLSHSDHL